MKICCSGYIWNETIRMCEGVLSHCCYCNCNELDPLNMFILIEFNVKCENDKNVHAKDYSKI